MTIDHRDIEKILGPLRESFGHEDRPICRWPGGPSRTGEAAKRPSNPGTYFQFRATGMPVASVTWQSTSDPPVSEWIGQGDFASHEEVLDRIRVTAFVAFREFVPILSAGHPWCLLDHQAGGNACSHIRFIGRRLRLRPEIESECLQIARHFYNSQMWFEPCLSDLIEYRARLQAMGLDCNSYQTYRYLTEAFYPIDLTQAFLDRMCSEPLSLESMVGGLPWYQLPQGAIIAFIAPNSD